MRAAELASRLPPPPQLERLSLAIAALEAVVSPEWEYRYFSFDPAWSAIERMASMRNGSGDQYFIVFGPLGTVVRAFDHESPLSPWAQPDGGLVAGLLDGYPSELQAVIDEPAFSTAGGPVTDLTFCAWRLDADEQWRAGTVEDDGGAADLLAVVIDGTPDGYRSFARDYYEQDPGEAVAAFYAMAPADAALVRRMNPEADAADVLAELGEMGYPVTVI